MARRFQFRLEQVLNLRKQVEEARVRELALAKGQLMKIEEALKENRETEAGFLDSYSEFEKQGDFNTDQAMVFCDYKEWLLRQEKEYRRREKEWIQEVEKRREATVKASRERQLLDNFKEKKQRYHANEVLGEEQRFLDEISAIAFVRRDRAEKAQAVDLTETLRR
jgi:flagellar protein FliJ